MITRLVDIFICANLIQIIYVHHLHFLRSILIMIMHDDLINVDHHNLIPLFSTIKIKYY